MARLYQYVGPDEVRRAAAGAAAGAGIRARADLVEWVRGLGDAPPVTATWVVDAEGMLRVAPRHSEHVACAGGGPVRAAGELTADASGAVVELSNQSTGYCPEPSCLAAVLACLDAAAVPHPGRWTSAFAFRRCEACGQRAIVKDDWFTCEVCGADLPREWNFG